MSVDLCRLYLLVLITCTSSSGNLDNCTDTANIADWFAFDLQSDYAEIDATITIAAKALRERTAFIVHPLLSPKGRSILQRELLSTQWNKQEIYRSVFQDGGDFEQFPDAKHPRNRVGYVRLGHINRDELRQQFEQLYAYDGLLQLLRRIVSRSGVYGSVADPIFRSTDRDGAIYALMADPNDHGSWHYDEHPFSCVVMLQKPDKGGILEIVDLEPPKEKTNSHEHEKDEEYWNMLQLIWDRDAAVQHYINRIEVDEGDLYCFTGNTSLHQVTTVEGNRLRGGIVMAFSTEKEFRHSENIGSLNFVDGIIDVVAPPNKIHSN